MAVGRVFILPWLLISMFFVWRHGMWANVDPDEGGSPSNRYNAVEYCCIYWRSMACVRREENKVEGFCYPEEPVFDELECDLKYKGPSYATAECQPNDVWPDCVMRNIRVNPTHKLSLVVHALALMFLFNGWVFTSFFLATILTLA